MGSQANINENGEIGGNTHYCRSFIEHTITYFVPAYYP